MIIGFDSKRAFTNAAGLGNYSRTLISNLIKYHPDNIYKLYTTETTLKLPLFNELINGNVSKYQYSKNVLKSYWRSFSIVNQLLEDNIELYHGLCQEIPFKINQRGIKSVVTIHDLIFKSFPETYSSADRYMFDIKCKYSCSKADKIIAISESTKRDIVKYYNTDPEKIEIIYQSCDPVYYSDMVVSGVAWETLCKEYSIPDEYLLYVGTIEKRKNLETLISAYQHLPADLHLPLVIVGRGLKYIVKLKKIIDRYKLGEKILFIENLSDTEHLKAIYKNSSLLIYPSFYEGFGLPVAEALLCKTPVVCSDSSSLREAGGSETLYFEPDNPEHLATCIEKVLGDASLSDKMKKNGYAYAHKKFNPKASTQKVIDLYKTCL